ncbi:hypothetical protein GCM10010524_26950 [Streptomyces mexicanus]
MMSRAELIAVYVDGYHDGPYREWYPDGALRAGGIQALVINSEDGRTPLAEYEWDEDGRPTRSWESQKIPLSHEPKQWQHPTLWPTRSPGTRPLGSERGARSERRRPSLDSLRSPSRVGRLPGSASPGDGEALSAR